MEDRIHLTIADGIADVRLNHAAKMNALDPAMFLAIAELGVRLKHNQSLRAVVLSGEGRAFLRRSRPRKSNCRGRRLQPFANRLVTKLARPKK